MRQAVRDLRAAKYDSTIDITSEIIEREPNHAGAHAVQFSALFKSKRLEQARRMGTIAAKLNPNSVFVLNNQACLQLEAKQPAAASGLLKSLIEQYGARGQWLYNLALAQRMVGNFDYAITTFSRTLDFDEAHDRAAFQLADCLTLTGNHEHAVRTFDYVRLLRSKHAASHSNYLHHAASNNLISKADLKLELALWRDRFIPAQKCYQTNPIKDEKAINIGFLIGKIPEHWSSMMVAPLINGLANEITDPTTPYNDRVTVYWHDEQLKHDLFGRTVNVVPSARFTDADFAREVRADGIDVLIDICGMRIGCRQRVLGLQVATKQLGWLAHEGVYSTDKIKALDIPYALEKPNHPRLKNQKPRTSKLPAKTFTALGCHRGLSEQVLESWASLLRDLPDWHLHISSDDKLINRRLRQQFKKQAIDESRLLFDTTISLHNQAIALDNFTDNDPVACMLALEQGATIVAIKGELYPAQHTAKLLEQCGHDDWVCPSHSAYKSRAIALTQESTLTGASKAQFDNSGVTDMPSFIGRFRTQIIEE